MTRKRILGAGLALAAALAALVPVAAGPAAAAADPNVETVTAVGSSGGVVARCPQGWTPSDPHITNADGTPLAPDQRWHYGPIQGDDGFAGWIAPYLNSPPPPEKIALTITCTRC
ncbi:hypothetical protein OU787_32510 [Kitasatospora sp. YST-16]|uniref:hypothetical protein n=1 Tax=unclassified Kitasatospora TaxID=2633591 RepID=UPI0004C3B93B|nr:MULTISPECIES: hypothetical protein [unclassified Kitasatospora]WAL75851.1 hypothetical protein OU787_32510 [Kitasatospora sp. YST-16]WNW41912.1 hypothetical protein RKE32_32425 [Streptomyces sp. Li-HN-5-13]